MGIYTTLWGKVQITQSEDGAVEQALQNLQSIGGWAEADMPMRVMMSPEYIRFISDYRADFIPFGALQGYEPEGFKENTSKVENGEWIICCAFKNYQSVLEKFLDMLPRIADGWLLHTEVEGVPGIHTETSHHFIWNQAERKADVLSPAVRRKLDHFNKLERMIEQIAKLRTLDLHTNNGDIRSDSTYRQGYNDSIRRIQAICKGEGL